MSRILNQILDTKKNNHNKNTKSFIPINEKLKIPYPLKPSYNTIIPMNIYQTWHTKILPHLMTASVNLIKSFNPKFNHYLYDDNDCREFIKMHFKPDVLNAYDSLIPGAYKADLWRYCVLFINGGIYLDIKYAPLNGFKFINLTETEHLVADLNNVGIYNALMVCLPRNEILFKSIRQIVENVNNKYYGDNFLEPTGPNLLTKFVSTSNEIVDLKHKQLYHDNNYKVIYFNDIPILKTYRGHTTERDKYTIKQHYSILWNNRKIYK